MPQFGFGTWLSQPNVVGESVKKALENGYKHIDCAPIYGNEDEIGRAMSEVWGSKVKREDVFITSKLWIADFGRVIEACEKSLKDLQLSYLDLYLIHLPWEVDQTFTFGAKKGDGIIGYKPQRIQQVWTEMEKLVEQGKVKAIGVSNFTTSKLKNLLEGGVKVPVSCNQVEMHPYCPQHTLLEYCEKNNITCVAYSPLGNPGRPANLVTETEPHLLSDPVVKSIAGKHSATPAQVLICYGLERKMGVLAKSVTESRIIENLKSLQVKLDTDDMIALNAISTQFRFNKLLFARKADEEVEDLWDGEVQ